MTYTEKQIENAKQRFNAFAQFKTLADFDVETIGRNVAGQRLDFHNNIVSEIKSGNEATTREWKLFFLNDEAKKDQKANESKTKLNANKQASADVLAAVKSAGKKLGDYYAFVKSNKKFAREFFSKKFTIESVDAFLSI